MTTAIESRQGLQHVISSVLTDAGHGRVAVYSSPPKQLAGTSVVIAPRAPYRVRDSFTGDRINLSVSVYIPHNVASDYLDAIDTLIEQLLTAIRDSDYVWENVNDVGSLDDGFIVANFDVFTILEQ